MNMAKIKIIDIFTRTWIKFHRAENIKIWESFVFDSKRNSSVPVDCSLAIDALNESMAVDKKLWNKTPMMMNAV